MNPDDGGYGYDDRPGRRRQQKKNNTSTILLVAAGVLVLVGAILIGRWAFSGDGGVGNDTIEAPNFVGLTKEAAEKQATNVDLILKFTEEPCEDQAKGNICDQDPDEGTSVEKESTVNLVVSTGAPKVEVPDVKGLSFADAEKSLKEKGFETEKKSQESSDTPDTVLSQDPAGGTTREKGTTITLTVAREASQVTVPNLLGSTPDAAKTLLESKGLVLGAQTEEESTAQAEGTVFEQSLNPGTDVDRGSTVTIKIAKAPANDKFAMPKVTEITVAQAKQILAQAGLELKSIEGAQEDTATVFQSNPSEGQEVKKGDKVTLIAINQQQGDNGGGDNGGGFLGGLTGNRD
ncbi:Stk1 family PASTA domain-containing Ser/Thr kinase [Streptomyces hirsutus]